MRLLLWSALPGGCIMGFVVIAMIFNLGVNVSTSMPLGVYQFTSSTPHSGDYVVLNLSENNPYASIIRDRKYLNDNRDTLIKRLAAVEGDVISLTDGGVAVNGIKQPCSDIRLKDQQGNNLPIFLKPGPVPSGKALVLSLNPNGFDGRYFGLLDMDSLQRVIPVFIFTKEFEND